MQYMVLMLANGNVGPDADKPRNREERRALKSQRNKRTTNGGS